MPSENDAFYHELGEILAEKVLVKVSHLTTQSGN